MIKSSLELNASDIILIILPSLPCRAVAFMWGYNAIAPWENRLCMIAVDLLKRAFISDKIHFISWIFKWIIYGLGLYEF